MNPEPEEVPMDPEFDEGSDLTDAELEERIAGGTDDETTWARLLKRVRETQRSSK